MPLVISGSPRVQSNLYPLADEFAATLREDLDYEYDESDGVVALTDAGSPPRTGSSTSTTCTTRSCSR